MSQQDTASISLTAAEARQLMLYSVAPVNGREVLPVGNALGRILAEAVVAPLSVPAHDNSAMDGYAVRLADLPSGGPATLKVVGSAFAGRPFSGVVRAGQAVRIMTGAMMPQGADSVVVQEVVEPGPGEGEIQIPAGQKVGQNLRRAGEDLTRGQVALAAGKRLGPAELGVLASLGIAEVKVRRPLRVAIFSTGDELGSVGTPLAPGEVYDSNRYTLRGLLAGMGAQVIDLGVVRDDPVALEAILLEAAAGADVIITSGGVSVGEADFVREILAKLGQVKFWKLAIKPGRPMAFGRVGDAWLFGLPGNPVAVMVSFTQFAADALKKLAGLDPVPEPKLVPVRLADDCQPLKKQAGRREYLRGRLELTAAGLRVAPLPYQGSGVLRSMSEADCFIVLTESETLKSAGDEVLVQQFSGLF